MFLDFEYLYVFLLKFMAIKDKKNFKIYYWGNLKEYKFLDNDCLKK